MWKYVSRRLKETFERTYNAFDIYRVRKCGGGTQQATTTKDNEHGGCDENYVEQNCIRVFSDFYICPINKGDKSSGSSGGGHYEKGKTYQDNGYHHSQIHNDLLGAITWSGAIVCGWYASQLLCLSRRQFGRKTDTLKINLNAPTRAIHSNILSHWAFASPTHPSFLSEKSLKENFDFKILDGNHKYNSLQFNVVEISNDNDTIDNSTCGSSRRTSTSSSTTSDNSATSATSSKRSDSTSSSENSEKQSVDEAVDDLVKFLGETEFKLSLQYISAGEYRKAVSHLKLASTHHHVSATFNLGLCYEQGLGVTKNLRRAMECYQYASSKGHSKAMYNLGVFYAQGLGGLDKDYEAARKCFTAAAKLGQKEAKKALGWSLEDDDQKNSFSSLPLKNATNKISKNIGIKFENMKITDNVIKKST